jgi:hypothetical protein
MIAEPLHRLVKTRQTYPLFVPFQAPRERTLQEKNAAKLEAAIAWLGERWILHPRHSAKRKAAA